LIFGRNPPTPACSSKHREAAGGRLAPGPGPDPISTGRWVGWAGPGPVGSDGWPGSVCLSLDLPACMVRALAHLPHRITAPPHRVTAPPHSVTAPSPWATSRRHGHTNAATRLPPSCTHCTTGPGSVRSNGRSGSAVFDHLMLRRASCGWMHAPRRTWSGCASAMRATILSSVEDENLLRTAPLYTGPANAPFSS
jgi:hypothetical protein